MALWASHGSPRGPPVAAEWRARCRRYAGAPASRSRQSEGQRLYGIILVIFKTAIRVVLLVAAARVLVRRIATLRQPKATAMEPIKPCLERRRRSRANGACACWKAGSSQKVMRTSTKELKRMWITTFSGLAKLCCWRRRQRRRAPPCRPSRRVRPAAALQHHLQADQPLLLCTKMPARLRLLSRAPACCSCSRSCPTAIAADRWHSDPCSSIQAAEKALLLAPPAAAASASVPAFTPGAPSCRITAPPTG